MLGQEVAHVRRLVPADALADELVEVLDHVPVGGEVLGRHRADGIAHALHVLLEHLAAQALDEVAEPVARVGVEEVVLAQVADPLADVIGQRIELVEPARGDVAQHVGDLLVGGVAGRRALELALHAGALLVDDVLELPPDVAEHVVELVALAQLLASAGQPIHQVLQPGKVRPGRVVGAPAALEQSTQRLGHVALGHDIVGERLEDLVRVEVRDHLLTVPAQEARLVRETLIGPCSGRPRRVRPAAGATRPPRSSGSGL